MSLIDALLLDPPKFDVWIALRTDGVLGSGTQADPYDGSVIKTATLDISLTKPGPNKLIAHAVTTTNHGFVKDDIITISRSSNPADGDWWDGTFKVLDATATTFDYVMQREPLSDTPTDRKVQKYVTWRFDQVMRNVPSRTTVHIGPGIFETRGAGEGEAFFPTPGWRPKTGQRILGAGMGLTTLKLVAAAAPIGNHKAAAIAAEDPLPDGLEVADLTIDCNADDQPSDILDADGAATQIVCAAIGLSGGGRHIYGHRVRAINFGSRYRGFYSENFVFFATPFTNDIVNAIWEDCVAEFPSANNAWNSFTFLIGGTGENTSGGAVRFNSRACVIRDCYTDGRNSYGPVVPVDTVSYDSTSKQVTLVTKIAHGHRKPGNLIVDGVRTSGGSFSNPYNGVFAIDQVVNDTTLKYTPGGAPPTADSPPGGTVGGAVSSTGVFIEAVQAGSDPNNARQLKLITKEPHFRTTNNTISLLSLDKANTSPLHSVTSAALFGTFPVVKYDPKEPVGSPPAGRQLEFLIYRDLDIPLGQLDYGWAIAKQSHTGTGSDDGITESNHISHIATGGPYQDTWSRRTLVARNNYYHNVNIGPAQQILGISPWWGGAIRLESLDYDDSELICPTLALHSFAEYENSTVIAKLYATDPNPTDYSRVVWTWHSFVKGDMVAIVNDSSTDAAVYTGTFKVLETPDARTFTYEALRIASVRGSVSQFKEANSYGLRPLLSIAKPAGPDPITGKWVVTATVRNMYQPPGGPSAGHGLEAGEIVQIINAGTLAAHSANYNGNFKIIAVPASDTFQFALDAEPENIGADFMPGYYGRVWRLEWCLLENNIIELNIRTTTGFNEPVGIFIYGGGADPQYRMRQFLAQGNLIRNVDNRADPNRSNPSYPGFAEGLRIGDGAFVAENALLQSNVVRLDRDEMSGYSMTCQMNLGTEIKTFDNNSPDGKLILARERALLFRIAPELVTRIQAAMEDAQIGAFLK